MNTTSFVSASIVMCLMCLMSVGCPSDSKDEVGDAGSTAARSDDPDAGGDVGSSVSGSSAQDDGGRPHVGASGTGAAAGTGGDSPIPSGGVATVIVKTAVAPLEVRTYELPDSGKFAGQRNADEFFANFDGAQDFGSMYGGDNINLRFGGFNRTGTFACGERAKPDDPYAVQTNVSLWTFVNAKSDAKMFNGDKPGSTCSVTVTKLDATTIEGTYEAKLFSDATTFVEISGAFHAIP